MPRITEQHTVERRAQILSAYRSRKLRADLSLTTNRTSKPATVLQDDSRDTYQLER